MFPTLFLPVFPVARRMYNFADGENKFSIADNSRKILRGLILPLPNQAELTGSMNHPAPLHGHVKSTWI